MRLITGLGNPGTTYQKTRHNLGFRVVEALAKDLGLQFATQKKLFAEIAKGTSLILAKPQTFMNESGKAVQKLLTTYNLGLTDLLVVQDEIDLPFGTVRLTTGGSAGHKGVASITTAIGPGFKRLRVGIENRKAFRVPDTETYVLQKFNLEEKKKLNSEIIPDALEEIKKWIDQ